MGDDLGALSATAEMLAPALATDAVPRVEAYVHGFVGATSVILGQQKPVRLRAALIQRVQYARLRLPSFRASS